MNERRQQEETLFEAARKLADPALRKAFLDGACGADSRLRQRLEDLLSSSSHAEAFFAASTPALYLDPGDITAEAAQEALAKSWDPEMPSDTLIGPYRIVDKIGEGGCGVVYVAEQHEPVRRSVALKIIKPGMDSKQVIARFEAERQALARMEHPNIAKVLDAGATPDGRPYFAMELVRGRRFTEYCNEHRLNLARRLELFIQVCEAVQHAHQKGVIHRDLKPSNILVHLQGGVPIPKIIDFGIAKATEEPLTDLTAYTTLHQLIGTPAYMSPEQASLNAVDIDTRSDIYSLGALLYELLCGQTPFDISEWLKRGLDEMRRAIREIDPPRPSSRLQKVGAAALATVSRERSIESASLLSALCGDLDWVVMKCLEKDRDRRYATAHDLAMDLKRFLEDQPVLARPPSTLYRLRKLARRNRAAILSATFMALALVIGLGISIAAFFREQAAWKLADQARRQEHRERLRVEAEELAVRKLAYDSDVNLAQDALAANNLGRARELLDRCRPKPRTSDLRGWEWRFLWRRCQSDALYTLCHQHNSVVMALFVAGGKEAALRNLDGTVSLWNLARHKLVIRLPALGYGRAMAASADGRLLAYASQATNGHPVVDLWNVPRQSRVAQLPSKGYPISLAISSDQTKLAAFCDDRLVRLWDLPARRLDGTFPATPPDGVHKGVVQFSPDGRTLAVGGTDAQIRVWDISSGSEKFRVRAASEGITALAFSPDGTLLASGSGFAEKTIKLWRAADGKPVGTLTGHGSWIASLAFAHGGRVLASTGGDQTIRVWDVASRRQVSILRGNLDEVYTVAFSPGDRRLITGSKDGEVDVWNATSRHRGTPYVILPFRAWMFAFTPNGKSLLTVNRNGRVVLWNSATAKPRQTITGLGSNNMSAAISPNGQRLAVGDRFGRIKVWNLAKGRKTAEFQANASPPLLLRFTRGGRKLLTVDVSRTVKIWDTRSWKKTIVWWLGKDVAAVCISPNDQLLATGDYDGSVRIWNIATHQILTSFKAHRGVVTGVAFSPNEKVFATSSEDGLAKLWDTKTYHQLVVLRGHLLGVHSVAFSPDGRRLATGSHAKEAIKLWDLSTDEELATLAGNGEFFYQIGFSPDGKDLAGVNIDGQLHLWETLSLKDMQRKAKALLR